MQSTRTGSDRSVSFTSWRAEATVGTRHTMTQVRHARTKIPLVLFIAAAGIASTGCASFHLPGFRSNSSAPSGPDSPTAVQAHVMRFADEYTSRVAQATDAFRKDVPTPEARLEATRWKLDQATAAYINATNANPRGGAVDMIVLATLSRMVMQDDWVDHRFSDSARSLLATHLQLEAEAWAAAAPILKPVQQQRLRDLIARWRAEHAQQTYVSQVRLLDLAMAGGEGPAASAERSNIFALFGLDPLSGLDPTVRQIEQTRLLGQRSLYYVQRMPNLLSWQAEVLSYQLAAAPESTQVLADAERFTVAAESFSKSAQQFPQVISDQREAAIRQVFDGLAQNDDKLRASLDRLRSMFKAGSELMQASDKTFKSLDGVMARFVHAKEQMPAPGAARPFNILEYATTAKEVTALLTELNTSLGSLEHEMPVLQVAASTLESAGNRLLDRVLLVGAVLIVLLLGGALAAALIYRRLGTPRPAGVSTGSHMSQSRALT